METKDYLCNKESKSVTIRLNKEVSISLTIQPDGDLHTYINEEGNCAEEHIFCFDEHYRSLLSYDITTPSEVD
jgi:hypothetical protein